MKNIPFFADLSTYSPQKSIQFYENVFGWNYYRTEDYYTAFIDHFEVVGLYETPKKFKQMRMPHFWMTYIKVQNVNNVVEKAKQLGGIIEIDQQIKNLGNIALIRDPLGAGFTIYEGNKLKNTRTKNTLNTLIWNELHISEPDKAIPFYQGVLDWQIKRKEEGYYNVFDHRNEHITDIKEISETYKGKYNYWICTFGVENLSKTKDKILKNGGRQVMQENDRTLFTDNSNEAFFYLQEV